jgi:hypothetical protein
MGDERDRAILRRTLSAAAWLYAAFGLLVGLSALLARSARPGAYDPALYASLLSVHALLLAAAGWTLWRPRPFAWTATLLAAAGSVFFTVLDARAGHSFNAVLDAVFPLLALGVCFKLRA